MTEEFYWHCLRGVNADSTALKGPSFSCAVCTVRGSRLQLLRETRIVVPTMRS